MANTANGVDDKIKEPLRLTQADIEKIKSLPQRTFIIGNMEKRGLYDEETRRFYFLDDNGEWNRKVAVINANSPPPTQTGQDESDSEDENDGEPPASDGGGKKKRPGWKGLLSRAKNDPDMAEAKASFMAKLSAPVSKKFPFTWFHIVIAGTILALLAIFVIIPTSNRVFNPNTAGLETPPASSGLPSTENTPTQSPPQTVESVNPDPTLASIHVIQVKQTLVPGDTITVDNIQAAGISAADYELLRASGRTLYQWEVANNLVGMVVNKYIPKGGYLASGDESTTYTPAANPWVNEQADMTYVSIPLREKATDPLLNFGSQVDIKVEKTVTNTTQQQDSETGKIVTVIETQPYEFKSAVVCDILNSDGQSLYPRYYAYIAIPAAERLDYLKAALLADPDLEKALTPAYILIKIESSTADAIKNFSGDDVKIAWGDFSSEAVDTTTDAKRTFAASASAMKQTITQAIRLNTEALQAAQNSIQSQAQAQLQEQQEGSK